MLPMPDHLEHQFRRVCITGEVATSPELNSVCSSLQKMLELRKAYVFHPQHDQSEHEISTHPEYVMPSAPEVWPQRCSNRVEVVDGLPRLLDSEGKELFAPINRNDYLTSLHQLIELCHSGPSRTYCYQRLQLLEARFDLHELLNGEAEVLHQKQIPHRDFYNVRKIDNHIHHSACMNQKHLLRFIKSRLKRCGDVSFII